MPLETNPASADSNKLYGAAPVHRPEHHENVLTTLLEHQSAKIPSSYFLFASVASMVLALGLHLAGKRNLSHFISKWPGPLLTMGVYNKLVKTLGVGVAQGI